MSAERQADVLRETDAEAVGLARTLLRAARHGALAVLDPATGAPMASRVAVATDADGAPLILTSTLSAHTGAMLADPRCALLLGEPGKGDPMAHPRLSVACAARRIERESAEQERIAWRYLARQPKAELYAGFADFAYFRLEPESASLVGGFGKAYLLSRAELLIEDEAVAALAARERGAVEHMNADHADAIRLYASHYGGAGADASWRLTGLDLDGMDLAAGDRVLRIPYPAPLTSAESLRSTLAAMARAAREAALA